MATSEIVRVAIGVDTGLRACGVAIADVKTSALLRAWLVKSPEQVDTGAQAWEAIARQVWTEINREIHTLLEQPELRSACVRLEALAVERQAIRGDRKRGLITKNPSQILGLASCAGAILATVQARQKVAVYPQSWNQSKKKEDSTASVWAGLTPAEQARTTGAELKSTGHNVIDAAGIARWAAMRARLGALIVVD